jgi:hypothetical protein
MSTTNWTLEGAGGFFSCPNPSTSSLALLHYEKPQFYQFSGAIRRHYEGYGRIYPQSKGPVETTASARRYNVDEATRLASVVEESGLGVRAWFGGYRYRT